MTRWGAAGVTGDAVRVRVAAPGDAPACAEVYAPVVRETPASFEVEPPDAEEIGRRMALAADGGRPWLVAEDGDQVVGYCYAAPLRDRAAYAWSVSTSIYLAASARGHGIGHALYAELLERLIAQGYVQALAGITLPNAASVALHEGFGFQSIGVERAVGFKLGNWYDVGWWQLTLRDPPATPTPAAPAPAW